MADLVPFSRGEGPGEPAGGWKIVAAHVSMIPWATP
jgi:hypothetical protein